MTIIGKLFAQRAALCGLIALGLSGAANAQSVSFGFVSGIDSGGSGLVGEYHAAPSLEHGAFSIGWGAAVRIDADGDAWAGIGVVANLSLSETIFAEASLMPGYYHASETILGGSLQFRTLFGLGLQVSESAALILSVDHISNANTNPFNPGMNSAALRLRTRY